MEKKFVAAVDFDDTIAHHDEQYNILDMVPAASEVINWMYDIGCYVIIWTVRAELDEVKEYCKAKNIKYHSINENAPFLDFETSRKVFADVYIDDRGIGTYKKIDWYEIQKKIKHILKEHNLNHHHKDEDIIQSVMFNQRMK